MLIASSHIGMRTVAIFIYTKICSGLLRIDLRENTMYTKNDKKKYCERILTWEYRYKNSQTDLNLITNTKQTPSPSLLPSSPLPFLSLIQTLSLSLALPHETFCLTLASCFAFADKRYANCLTDNVPHNADKLLMNVLNIFRSGAWAMGGGRWALPNFGKGACASNCISCRSFVSTNVVGHVNERAPANA